MPNRVQELGSLLFRRWEIYLRMLIVLVLAFSGAVIVPNHVGQARSEPSKVASSTHCHVTDGNFTICPDGVTEWSDVPGKFFPDSQAYLYADQANLDPSRGSSQLPKDTFLLMYDECGLTLPLGPDGYFQIHFNTVDKDNGTEKLAHYVLHVFGDNTIMFWEDGMLHPARRASVIEGMKAA